MTEQEFLNSLGDLTGKIAIVTGYISHLNIFPGHTDGSISFCDSEFVAFRFQCIG
jgi:hypothetical protein